MSLARDAAAALARLGALLAERGRLEALLLLAEPSIEASLTRTARMADLFARAADVAALAEDRLRGEPLLVDWLSPPDCFVAGGAIARAEVERRGAELAREITAAEAEATEVLGRSPLLGGVRAALAHAGSGLGPASVSAAAAGRAPTQRLRCPPVAPLDPAFALGASLLDPPARQAVSELDAVPFVWLVAAQEQLAAQVCALCIAEHDGLPIAFHRDLALQAADEARHARFFFACAVEALPDFVGRAPESHPRRAGAVRFLATGAGLELPAEGVLYGSFWHATLFERLALMQVDGERGAVDRLQKKLEAAFFRDHPHRADDLALTLLDEKRHERMGLAWLAHLVPDAAERARQMEAALSFRGVLMAMAFAEARGQSLPDLLQSMGIQPS